MMTLPENLTEDERRALFAAAAHLPRITPRRHDLLANIGDVGHWPDGVDKRYTLGRFWRASHDVVWLLGAGLIELDPETENLNVKGYRRTHLGDAVLAANQAEE